MGNMVVVHEAIVHDIVCDMMDECVQILWSNDHPVRKSVCLTRRTRCFGTENYLLLIGMNYSSTI